MRKLMAIIFSLILAACGNAQSAKKASTSGHKFEYNLVVSGAAKVAVTNLSGNEEDQSINNSAAVFGSNKDGRYSVYLALLDENRNSIFNQSGFPAVSVNSVSFSVNDLADHSLYGKVLTFEVEAGQVFVKTETTPFPEPIEDVVTDPYTGSTPWSSWEEGWNDIAANRWTNITEQDADAIIADRLDFITVYYGCLEWPDCTAQLDRIIEQSPNTIIIMYADLIETHHCQSILNARILDAVIKEHADTVCPEYWLKNVDGSHVENWGYDCQLDNGQVEHQKAWVYNPGAKCQATGQYFYEYVAQYLNGLTAANQNYVGAWVIDNGLTEINYLSADLNRPTIDINTDGAAENRWDVNRLWRESYQKLIDSVKAKMPADKMVGIRSYGNYDYRADFITVEYWEGLDFLVSGLNNIYDMIDRLSRQCRNYKFCLLNYAYENHDEQKAELANKAYQIALLAGAYVSFDFGPNGHGDYQYSRQTSLLTVPGKAEPMVYPYQETFSAAKLAGNFLTEASRIKLTSGQSVSFQPATTNNLVTFRYHIIGGMPVQSSFVWNIKGSDKAAEWEDSFVSGINSGSQIRFSFNGPGYVLIDYISVRDKTSGQKYFSRQYENITAVWNVE